MVLDSVRFAFYNCELYLELNICQIPMNGICVSNQET